MKKHPVICGLLAIIYTVIVSENLGAAVAKQLSQFPEGERLIYGQLLDAYHRNVWQEVVSDREKLERNYPSSVHLDKAYYLTGMIEFQQNRYGEALRTFSVIRDRYVKSTKRASALFAIAMTYDRLKLEPQSHAVLQQLLKEYPGSPESQRAWMHLRVQKEIGKVPARKG